MKLDQKPYVAIIGRPNVGKSTLFNCLIEEKKALVSEMPGTTRDIITGKCFWQGKEFTLVDTGGLEIINPKKIKEITAEKIKSVKNISLLVEKKILSLLKEIDLIIFLTDVGDGPLPQEKKISLLLSKLGKPIILAANKADNPRLREKARDPEWLRLALGSPLPLSAANGSGTGDLLDEIIKTLTFPQKLEKEEAPEKIYGEPGRTIETKPIKIAIIGKPNVGKSSLLNALLGEERALVSEMRYTTRESIDTLFLYQNQPFVLIDTAGIRKRGKIVPGIEKISVTGAIESIKNSDIVFFVTEAHEPLTVQDSHLAGLILEKEKGVVIIANKWDLVKKKDTKIQKKFIEYYYAHFPYLAFAPLAFTSALTGEKVKKLLDLVLEIKKEREKEIPKKELNKIIKPFPRSLALREIKQIGVNPPKFLIKSWARPPYPKYLKGALEKKIRSNFVFLGTPIRVIIESLRHG